MSDVVLSHERRVSLNIRVDPAKHEALERMRKTGFGLAVTERNRSDVYNEVVGNGIQLHIMRQEMGDRDFERIWKVLPEIHALMKGMGDREFEQLWRILLKVNFKKINLEKVEKLLA